MLNMNIKRQNIGWGRVKVSGIVLCKLQLGFGVINNRRGRGRGCGRQKTVVGLNLHAPRRQRSHSAEVRKLQRGRVKPVPQKTWQHNPRVEKKPKYAAQSKVWRSHKNAPHYRILYVYRRACVYVIRISPWR